MSDVTAARTCHHGAMAPSDTPSGTPLPADVPDNPPEISVGAGIRLGQFLKFAGLVDSGAEARDLIASGDVLVDGAEETRRGRQLRGGELVEVDTADGRVAARVVLEG